ncbi:hypothetical protein [Candidatus Thiodiazotropha sp. CDECU1]|uniref:hypothetical protein n=1 Tax=Candidatus Thiodiazotropha sp. CDECU1 TaxID=3065865 RepID=UPI00292F5985|nr:hypothetical protein [Candidatus Thiodiazotropha sp. CDECU1]
MKTRITQVETEYACLWFYPEVGIIHHQFLQPISGDDFRSVLMSGLRLMQEHGAQKWLSDDRKNSILPAEDSAWSQDYWLPRAYQAGWKYWAVLPPAKARGQINMKRLMEFVGEQRKVLIDVFSDPDQAWQWLASQSAE